MKKLLYFLPFLFWGCGSGNEGERHSAGSEKEDSLEHHSHAHAHSANANEYMNQSTFDELIQRFESPERTEYQQPEKVLEFLGEIKGKKIMDLGAGSGYFSFRFAKAGAEVIAADISQQFLDYIAGKMKTENYAPGKIELRLVPTDDPKLAQAEVDKVIVVNTYHHIENRIPYFKSLRNGIKPGGELVIIDFFKRELPVGPPLEHKLSDSEVIRELKEAGFTKFKVEYQLLKYQYIIRAQ